MSRIIGVLFSAACVRLAGASFAIWLGLTIGGQFIASLQAATAGLAGVGL